HTPYPDIVFHSAFPYAVFGYYCDAVMPQEFWEFYSRTPAQMIADMDNQWKTWQNSLTGTNRNAIKPIIPVAQTFPQATGADITAFVNGVKADTNGATAGGYHGISFWDCQERTADMESAVGLATIGLQPFAPPLLQTLTLVGGGSVQLSLNAQLGDSYAIDVSSDLANWAQLATFVNTNGHYQFTDASVTNRPTGFYRARWVAH
ncbi:MAG: Xanthan lyase, partial [Pedosphaera sp.]|nr:Xanthan lyase [Pedosphaera sp.]